MHNMQCEKGMRRACSAHLPISGRGLQEGKKIKGKKKDRTRQILNAHCSGEILSARVVQH